MNLSKSVKKTLLTLARFALPTLGFGFTCLGAFLLSTSQGRAGHTAAVASAYACFILGFILLIVGLSWTICLSVRSKAFLHSQRRSPRHRDSHVFTVDR